MALFNFRNKSYETQNGQQSLPTISPNEQYSQEMPERLFIENNLINNHDKVSSDPQVIDNNINLLFNFLDKNFESKGYDDALINPDANHLKENVEAIKYELIRTINKVKTFYEDFIQEINYHIDSRGRSGMVDTVEELKMKKDIAESHIKKVMEIEDGAKNNTGDSQGILISYTRGFKNGLAAISHDTILKKRL